MNTEQQIRQRIDNFVRDLQALLVDAAKESLEVAFGGKASARPAREVSPARAGQPGGGGRKKARKAATRGGGRVRRSAEELAAVQDKIVGLLNKRPGLTSEEIQDALKLEKKDVQRPLTLLREEKRVKTKGQRRGMKYSAT